MGRFLLEILDATRRQYRAVLYCCRVTFGLQALIRPSSPNEMLYLQKGPNPSPTTEKKTTLGGLSCKFRGRRSTRASTSAVAAAASMSGSNGNGGGASSALYGLYGPNVLALLFLRLPPPPLPFRHIKVSVWHGGELVIK